MHGVLCTPYPADAQPNPYTAMIVLCIDFHKRCMGSLAHARQAEQHGACITDPLRTTSNCETSADDTAVLCLILPGPIRAKRRNAAGATPVLMGIASMQTRAW